MKIIIYNRTSTEEQNPENQLKDCQSINRYGDAQIIQDQQSAWKDNVQRRGFEELKRQIKAGGVEHLIVWDLDRLYRNRLKLKQFFELCKAYKCQIHSFRQRWLEDINKTPQPWNEIIHDMLINIFGWIAEDESNRKSERVKAAIRKLQKGTFSYKGNRWGRKPISTFKRNRIAELRGSGMSMKKIAKEVNASVGAVHKILTENTQKNQKIGDGS